MFRADQKFPCPMCLIARIASSANSIIAVLLIFVLPYNDAVAIDPRHRRWRATPGCARRCWVFAAGKG